MSEVKGEYGSYLVRERIGTGPIGEVYAIEGDSARQGETDDEEALGGRSGGRLVLKEYPPPFATDPHFARRLREGVERARRLVHPNLPGIVDFGMRDRSFFVIHRVIEGPSLTRILAHQRVRREPLSPHIVGFLVFQLCEALQVAHRSPDDRRSAALVHGDLKPSNVLVDRRGFLNVLDLGTGIGTMLHGPGSLVWFSRENLSYAAPEVINGDPIDPRTDVFSVAALMFELLTLEPLLPSFSSPVEALRYVGLGDFSERFALLEALGIDPALVAVLKTALHPRARKRYPDAGALADAMSELTLEGIDSPSAFWQDVIDMMEGSERVVDGDPSHPASIEVEGDATADPWDLCWRDRVLCSSSFWEMQDVSALPEAASLPAASSGESSSAPCGIMIVDDGADDAPDAAPIVPSDAADDDEPEIEDKSVIIMMDELLDPDEMRRVMNEKLESPLHHRRSTSVFDEELFEPTPTIEVGAEELDLPEAPDDVAAEPLSPSSSSLDTGTLFELDDALGEVEADEADELVRPIDSADLDSLRMDVSGEIRPRDVLAEAADIAMPEVVEAAPEEIEADAEEIEAEAEEAAPEEIEADAALEDAEDAREEKAEDEPSRGRRVLISSERDEPDPFMTTEVPDVAAMFPILQHADDVEIESATGEFQALELEAPGVEDESDVDSDTAENVIEVEVGDGSEEEVGDAVGGASAGVGAEGDVPVDAGSRPKSPAPGAALEVGSAEGLPGEKADAKKDGAEEVSAGRRSKGKKGEGAEGGGKAPLSKRARRKRARKERRAARAAAKAASRTPKKAKDTGKPSASSDDALNAGTSLVPKEDDKGDAGTAGPVEAARVDEGSDRRAARDGAERAGAESVSAVPDEDIGRRAPFSQESSEATVTIEADDEGLGGEVPDLAVLDAADGDSVPGEKRSEPSREAGAGGFSAREGAWFDGDEAPPPGDGGAESVEIEALSVSDVPIPTLDEETESGGEVGSEHIRLRNARDEGPEDKPAISGDGEAAPESSADAEGEMVSGERVSAEDDDMDTPRASVLSAGEVSIHERFPRTGEEQVEDEAIALPAEDEDASSTGDAGDEDDEVTEELPPPPVPPVTSSRRREQIPEALQQEGAISLTLPGNEPGLDEVESVLETLEALEADEFEAEDAGGGALAEPGGDDFPTPSESELERKDSDKEVGWGSLTTPAPGTFVPTASPGRVPPRHAGGGGGLGAVPRTAGWLRPVVKAPELTEGRLVFGRYRVERFLLLLTDKVFYEVRPQNKEGDWPCISCGFASNPEKADMCVSCGAPYASSNLVLSLRWDKRLIQRNVDAFPCVPQTPLLGRIYEQFVDDGMLFRILEPLSLAGASGHLLAQFPGVLDSPLLASVGKEAALALHYLHEHGVSCPTLSDDNILIRGDRVLIFDPDFGDCVKGRKLSPGARLSEVLSLARTLVRFLSPQAGELVGVLERAARGEFPTGAALVDAIDDLILSQGTSKAR